MEKSLQENIAACLSQARAENGTRENSLVITKLQEAMMWQNEHQRALTDAARRSGVGFNGDVHGSRQAPPQASQPPQSTQHKLESQVIMNNEDPSAVAPSSSKQV